MLDVHCGSNTRVCTSEDAMKRPVQETPTTLSSETAGSD